MSPTDKITLFVGILSFAGGLLAAILSPISTKLVDRIFAKEYLVIDERRAAVQGTWKGSNLQAFGMNGKPIEVKLLAKLVFSGKFISGEAVVSWLSQGKEENLEAKVEGGFFNDAYLRISFYASDTRIQNFGVMFLQLEPDGTTMTGKMIGFGHLSKSIINGTVELHKV